MKYYIATMLENAKEHNLLMEALNKLGHQITYDWTVHGSVQHDKAKLEEVCKAEMQGVRDADMVFVLLPGGRGTHAELGLACALNKDVLIIAEQKHGFFELDKRTCVFYHAPYVMRFIGTTEEFIPHLPVFFCSAFSVYSNG